MTDAGRRLPLSVHDRGRTSITVAGPVEGHLAVCAPDLLVNVGSLLDSSTSLLERSYSPPGRGMQSGIAPIAQYEPLQRDISP